MSIQNAQKAILKIANIAFKIFKNWFFDLKKRSHENFVFFQCKIFVQNHNHAFTLETDAIPIDKSKLEDVYLKLG